jgi:hypothetical protein
MVGLARESEAAYSVRTILVPLKEAAHQKLYPAEWRNAAGNDVQPAFVDYAAPLVGAIPCYPAL